MRRALPLLLAFLALLVAGCGGTPTAEQQSRAAFLTKTKNLSDQELARLCPALYPRDFLSPKGPDKYNYKKDKTLTKPTASQRAAAKGQDCGTSAADGTPPKK